MAKPVTIPTPEDERELLGLWEDSGESVTIRGRQISLKLLTGHARHKISRILLDNKSREDCVSHKCVAAARLNGFFKIKLLYWILWRWYFYVRQYTEDELSGAIAMIKKKIPLESYFENTISLIGIRETIMQMSREEVYRILQERSSGNPGNSARSNPG